MINVGMGQLRNNLTEMRKQPAFPELAESWDLWMAQNLGLQIRKRG
ncbi:MAG: hypothetical protein CM1200mP18_10760 [Gammaproteobacteria bacterium]|nr:MAG: hypothetical protein CM1200mP18_10760 [Gammaproteobacteria bacterium]